MERGILNASVPSVLFYSSYVLDQKLPPNELLAKIRPKHRLSSDELPRLVGKLHMNGDRLGSECVSLKTGDLRKSADSSYDSRGNRGEANETERDNYPVSHSEIPEQIALEERQKPPQWNTSHTTYMCADGVNVALPGRKGRNGDAAPRNAVLRGPGGADAKTVVSGTQLGRAATAVVAGADGARTLAFPNTVRRTEERLFCGPRLLRSVVVGAVSRGWFPRSSPGAA